MPLIVRAMMIALLIPTAGCKTLYTKAGLFKPVEFYYDEYLPAGDTLVLEAAILRVYRTPVNEYPQSKHIPHRREQEQWSSDNPEVATVRKGVVTGHMPGAANIIVQIGEYVASERVRVVIPLDSIVFRAIRFRPRNPHGSAANRFAATRCGTARGHRAVWREGTPSHSCRLASSWTRRSSCGERRDSGCTSTHCLANG
jgi:hypothetical protein